jgi:hypothetical protein
MIYTAMAPTQTSIDRISMFDERRFLDALSLTAISYLSDAHRMSDYFESGGAGRPKLITWSS